MLICYVDEAGSTAALSSPTYPVEPVLVVAGFAIRLSRLAPLTVAYLNLKRRFFPGKHSPAAHFLDGVLVEIKGSSLRKTVALGSHAERMHVIGFMDQVVGLLATNGAKLLGRVWIKGIGGQFIGRPIHTCSIQYMCNHFQALLHDFNESGMMVIDNRSPVENSWVSHSVFTQKFKLAGDAYARVLELPTFGHSENHVGIQIADILSSGLLSPMAIAAYCSGHVTNLHVRPNYNTLRVRYGTTLQGMQYRRTDGTGRWMGGITVCDAILGRPGGLLFRDP